MKQDMLPWPKIFRVAALLLLFSAAVDIIGVDIFGAVLETQAASNSCPDNGGDECFCCCSHLLVGAQVQFNPIMAVTPAPEPLVEIPLSLPLTPPSHPPRA
jgi:hypothetical protein